jgi:TetR/AcrR family transcriptional repressor of nem operon
MKNPVGRPRGFDEDQVLDAAMGVFWRKGYEGTSLADLLAATGLHKGSLYQSFGDKHTLFVTALRRYFDNMRTEMSGVLLGASTAIEGMRNAMHKIIDMSCDEGDSNPGCMALNSLVEGGSQDADVMSVLQNVFETRKRMITQSVQACQQEGSMRKDWAADRIASMIETMEAGLAATLKGPVTKEHAYAVIDDMLSILKPQNATSAAA